MWNTDSFEWRVYACTTCHRRIQVCPDCGQPLKPNWEDVKVDIMLVGLRAKFTQWPSLRTRLLATGTAILHEDSPWDKYWGYAKGEGLDKLGQLIMQVREELK